MYEKIGAAIATLTLLCVISVITYNELTQERVTVVLELKQDADPFSVLPQLPGTVIGVKSLDKSRNKYEVKMVSKHSITRLLELIRGEKDIKSARVQ
jgi:hypothetical protein